MNHSILGTIRNGRLEFDEPLDWPEGQRVAVLPREDGEPVGTIPPRITLPSGQIVYFNGSPEHTRLLVEQMDRGEALEMTPEEEAEWNDALKWSDDYTRNAVRKDMGLDK